MAPSRIPLATVSFWVVALNLAAVPIHADPLLSITVDRPAGEVMLAASGDTGHSHRIEATYDLNDWGIIGAAKNSPSWPFTDPDGLLAPEKIYRLAQTLPPSLTPHASWKTAIELPGDPFLSPPLSGTGSLFESTEVRWIKFALIIDDLPRVVFQDSEPYPFHYHFAVERLSPFIGMGVEAFNELSLSREDQQVILGAVLWAPTRGEYGIQFVGNDPYPREMLRFLYNTVESNLSAHEGARGFYMPTFEQSAAAENERSYFESHGIEVSSVDRWFVSDGCYTQGWALGRLVFVPGDQIDAAYQSGQLLPTDILLTDGVPAEIPFVAGIVTTAPAAPNSHVAILAQSFGVPFVYLADEADQEHAHSLVGDDVVLRAEGNFSCNIRLIDASGVPATMRDALLDLKTTPPVSLTAMAVKGGIVVENLTNVFPADIRFIGGKAANFGFLRRVIPNQSPDAIAFTFDLWNAYLDQLVAPANRSLRGEINMRLADVTWPPDLVELEPVLDGIRDLIEDDADFTPAQKTAILSELVGFDPARKIRFRSSTNAEDSENFIGAGLYSSFSGCVLDDTDDDEEGPSHCDLTQDEERGVFRAMRKVYASFYNTNAFLERLRRGVDESEVGMAILVHHSFPDEFEAANGVASSYSRSQSSRNLETKMVSQIGANSVTNPEGGSLPEVVQVNAWRGNFSGVSLDHQQRSSLLLLGQDHVMQWEEDYRAFNEMFFDLVEAYEAHFPAKERPLLEFEFKKLTDDSLVIKQIREVPDPELADAPAIALLDAPSVFKTFQGESGSVFGNHRLKSLFVVRTSNGWLNDTGLADSFINSIEWESAPDGSVLMRTGSPASWPQPMHSNSGDPEDGVVVKDGFTLPSQGGATDYEFEIRLPAERVYGPSPVRTMEDFAIYFHANYENALPDIDHTGETTVSHEVISVVPGTPEDPLTEGSLPQSRSASASRAGVQIDIEFFWPPNPTGPTAGYTAPLEKWEQTTISGLTANPIVLSGYFSQTYRPGHHNFTEEFLFEPRLEEGISQAVIQELEAQNVRQIHVSLGFIDPVIKVVGTDGSFRDLN